MKLALVKSDSIDDWYTIERAEHEHRHWMERDSDGLGASLRYSGRISDACVEGTAAEMLSIAEAIEMRSREEFKRCAVEVKKHKHQVLFWSPRNSLRHGECTLAEADELAAEIRQKIGGAQ